MQQLIYVHTYVCIFAFGWNHTTAKNTPLFFQSKMSFCKHTWPLRLASPKQSNTMFSTYARTHGTKVSNDFPVWTPPQPPYIYIYMIQTPALKVPHASILIPTPISFRMISDGFLSFDGTRAEGIYLRPCQNSKQAPPSTGGAGRPTWR